MNTALGIATLLGCATVMCADTITLSTPSDVYTFSHTGTSHGVGDEFPGSCNQPVSPSTDCALTVFDLLSVFPVPLTTTTYYVYAPDGKTLSETIALSFNVLLDSYDIMYQSGLEGSGETVPPGSTTFVDNGGTQLITTVTWSDATTDQIYISGPEAGLTSVPEPGTASFAVIGLFALMFLANKRIKLNRTPQK